MDYLIRPIEESEYPILEDLIYYAIWSRSGEPLPRNVIKLPENFLYVTGFGMLPGDFGLVAEDHQQVIGAVWIRTLFDPIRGFANIDAETPELTISLLPEYRHHGIGTELMKRMLSEMKKRGYHRASLSVDKFNYALRLYQHLGFQIVKELSDDYIMVIDLINVT